MIKKIIYFLKSLFIFSWIVLLALILRWSVLEVYMIPQQGMMPTLFSGDYVMVNKLSYGLQTPFFSRYISQWSVPKRGDVIVFRSPFNKESLSIRRVIGVPGDRVFFENGNLYINEKKIVKKIPLERKRDSFWIRDEDFSDGGMTEDKSHYVHWQETLFKSTYSILLKKKKSGYLIFGPYLIPPHHYFVMGDHRDKSQDSRTWPAQIQKAQGTVTFSRSHAKSVVFIAKGTLVRTQNLKLPQYFKTQKNVSLTGLFVDVDVKATKAGLSGNVSAGRINFIENSSLSKEVSVSNVQKLTGGKDENLVSALDILGKVNRVLFSCKKKIAKSSFLCDPTYIRWGRFFYPVHH